MIKTSINYLKFYSMFAEVVLKLDAQGLFLSTEYAL